MIHLQQLRLRRPIVIKLFFLFQNFTPLEEMRLARSACFPSSTKTGGMEIAPSLTPQQGVFGVRLKQNMNMNSGDTARQIVSTAFAFSGGLIWFHDMDTYIDSLAFHNVSFCV